MPTQELGAALANLMAFDMSTEADVDSTKLQQMMKFMLSAVNTLATEQQAMPVFVMAMLSTVFFSGYPLMLSQMHPWWHWAAQSSYFRWSVQGLFQNQFTDHQEEEGEFILKLYSFNSYDKWTCHHFVIFIALAIGAAQLPILFVRARRGSGAKAC